MTGCSVLYQYNDKKLYTVILYVPKKNVAVKLDKKDTEFRRSHENPAIIEFYKKHLGEVGSHKAHELLHTTYADLHKGSYKDFN